MGKKKLLAIVLSSTLILSGLLTGCGQSSTKTKEASSTPQVINVASAQDIATLDTSKIADQASNTIAQETQEGLVRLDNKKIVPAGAEKWETSTDGLTWTFHLRDYSWSDDKKVTAQDYVYAVKRVFDPATACPNAGILYSIKGSEEYNTNKGKAEAVGVKAIDEKTLQFTLKTPTPYFIQLMNFVSLLPVRQDVVEKGGLSYGTDAKGVVYTGPFVVEQWVKGSKIVLKKNAKYWDAKSVKLDTATVNIIPEESTSQQLFDSKGLDVIQNVKGEYVQKLKAGLDKGDIQSIIGDYPSISYIAFNNKSTNKLLTNAKVRLALSIAIDREGFVKNVVKKDKAAYGFVPYGMNNGDKIYREAVKEPLKALTSQDPKKLYEEGLKELGLDTTKQYEITFLQKNANSGSKVAGEFFQDQWQKKIGVKVKIDVASDSATFNKMIMKGTYEVAQTGWGADYNDPMTFMGMYITGDGNNAAFFSDADYDRLVKDAATNSDMAKRLEAFTQAEKILVADKSAIAPLTFQIATNYIQKYVKGLQIQAGGPAYELKYVYIDKK